jgi:DnaJ-class molecular chaperone
MTDKLHKKEKPEKVAQPCPDCNGEGIAEGETCQRCEGEGVEK